MMRIPFLLLSALLGCGPAAGSPALVLKNVTVIDMTPRLGRA
ncbi:MAG TPA: hypothetical protein VNW71_05125 [Thermoanaerobaculia bacterium]|nr:hypothetical protein [Thermoanaerobaculia bacterium]